MPTRIFALVLGTILALGTAILAQQHSYTQAEIDAGAKLYDSNCGSCHGENGDKIVGIDFSKGTFKTARTDDDLIRIIRNGVPNTGMPPNPFSETQANTIVAYMRSMLGGRIANSSAIASLTGDPARGKTIFESKRKLCQLPCDQWGRRKLRPGSGSSSSGRPRRRTRWQRPPRQCRLLQLVVVRARLRQEARLPRVVPAADVDGAELALRAAVQHLRPAVHQQRQRAVAVGEEAAARQPRSNSNVPSWIRAQR